MNLENENIQAHDVTAESVDAQQPVELKNPSYAPLTTTNKKNESGSIKRFFDVQVTVSAELGQVQMPIGELVELGEGSVIELDRQVSTPIDLMAQGVRVATGEVVVVNDCFAIRIKTIESTDHAAEPE